MERAFVGVPSSPRCDASSFLGMNLFEQLQGEKTATASMTDVLCPSLSALEQCRSGAI